MEPAYYMEERYYSWILNNPFTHWTEFLRQQKIVTKFRKFSRGLIDPYSCLIPFLKSFGHFPTPLQAMNEFLNDIQSCNPKSFQLGYAAFADCVRFKDGRLGIVGTPEDEKSAYVGVVFEDCSCGQFCRSTEVEFANS